MATKAELEEKLAALETENAKLAEELALATEAAAAAPAAAEPVKAPATCINCGQHRTPIEVVEDGRYHCPVCKHTWTDAEEQAPFRRRG